MRRLLLVDDDIVFAGVMQAALVRRGFEVRLAHAVEPALGLLSDWLPDDAIVDLRMPGSSGLALISALRKANPAMRIVMLTGYASIATAVEAIKLGATHYLAKPADVDDIVAALERDRGDAGVEPSARPPSVQRLEWEHIQKVLGENEGNVSATARALGMHRRTLQRKLFKRPVREE